MTNWTTSRRGLPLARLLSIGLLAGIASPARAQAVHTACYVPAVGAVYLILKAGLPPACFTGHVQITWDGDITGVTAGSGLSGGGTSGAVTLSVNTSVIQQRVTGTCTAGSSISAIGSTGTVTCEPDGVTGWVRVNAVGTAPANSAAFNVVVTCPAGRVVLGGGFGALTFATSVITESAPLSSTQWRVTLRTGASSETIVSWAICANA